MKTPAPKPKPARRTPAALRPFVYVNMAMTADGKIATTNRAISSLGSPVDLYHLYELRSTADAILCGARTIDVNPVTLGTGPAEFRAARRRRGLPEYCLRIIVTGRGTINPNAAIFKKRFSPIIVLTTQRAGPAKLKQLRALADEVIVCGKRQIDFPAAFARLRQEWKIKRLLCEGGGELNDALFQAGLIDELNLTICPYVIGGRHAPTIADGAGVPNLAQAARMRLVSRTVRAKEIFLRFRAEQTR